MKVSAADVRRRQLSSTSFSVMAGHRAFGRTPVLRRATLGHDGIRRGAQLAPRRRRTSAARTFMAACKPNSRNGVFLLPRQLSCPFALLTVQRCRCCRVAGSGHSNGSPIACVGNSCRRHSARCHRRGRALVCIAYDPVPGDRYRSGLVASPRSAPCAVPGAFRMGMPVVFRLGLQRTGEKDRQRD